MLSATTYVMPNAEKREINLDSSFICYTPEVIGVSTYVVTITICHNNKHN